MTAAHGGYGSERVPLGGGAAVFERLAREWARSPQVELHLCGPGPEAPAVGAHYHRAELLDRPPSALDEWRYARFCREFEAHTTRLALELRPDLVLAHDLSEGPDFEELSYRGIESHVIFHVDVVDFFHRIYMGAKVSPERLARWNRTRMGRLLPDILKLVFDKQQRAVNHCRSLIVPSQPMADILERCYPGSRAKTHVFAWGAPSPDYDEEEVEREARDLRSRLQLGESPLLMTLSRISPEKGQHRLLEALLLGEAREEVPPGLTLVIAGKGAFMKGQGYRRRLLGLAARLRKVRVLFPGHLGGMRKRAWLRASDLFVVASRHESYGLTTLEAMQQRCPVVAIESYGTAATVDHGVGCLVPDGSQLSLRLWCALRSALGSSLESWQREAVLRAAECVPARLAARLLAHFSVSDTE